MGKLNWGNLTKEERATYVWLQMSLPSGYNTSGYPPNDCGECGACGQPTLGTGWCQSCYQTWKELDDKLRGKGDNDG